MAIRAADLTFRELFLNPPPRHADPNHPTYVVELLTAGMIEIENTHICLATVNARVLKQICNDKFTVSFSIKYGILVTAPIVGYGVLPIVRAAVSALAFLAIGTCRPPSSSSKGIQRKHLFAHRTLLHAGSISMCCANWVAI